MSRIMTCPKGCYYYRKHRTKICVYFWLTCQFERWLHVGSSPLLVKWNPIFLLCKIIFIRLIIFCGYWNILTSHWALYFQCHGRGVACRLVAWEFQLFIYIFKTCREMFEKWKEKSKTIRNKNAQELAYIFPLSFPPINHISFTLLSKSSEQHTWPPLPLENDNWMK